MVGLGLLYGSGLLYGKVSPTDFRGVRNESSSFDKMLLHTELLNTAE